MKHVLSYVTDKNTIKIGLWRHGNGGYSNGITIYKGSSIFYKYFERHERNRLISFPSYYTKEEEIR